MSKIAACMIVRDAEKTIEGCLDSIRPFVDGVFVYDTGSTDGTLELLEKLSEKKAYVREGLLLYDKPNEGEVAEIPLAPIVVERGEWRDDFAWAREQSFAMPPEDFDWLLWLDDDDIVIGAEHLWRLAGNTPADVDGYVLFYDYARDETGQNVCQLWRERLMRRSAGYTWKQPVHEVLVPPEGHTAALAQLPAEQIRYVHRRDLVPERYEPDRNLKILRRHQAEAEAKGEEADPRTLAYLGTELMTKGEWEEAVTFLDAYIARQDALWSDERMQVMHKLGMCLRILGNIQGSIDVELRAVNERMLAIGLPAFWAENEIGLAQSFTLIGAWDRALEWARRGFSHGMPVSALILNPVEFTLVPLMIEAEALVNLGQLDTATVALQRAFQLFPQNLVLQQKAAELERKAAEDEIVSSILKLREVLLRHDEVLKAWGLMQAVPYLVAERPEIAQAKADTRGMVAHYLHPEEYARWYRDEPKVSTIPLDYMPPESDEPRFGLEARERNMLEGLRQQEEALGRSPVVLDLGCNDAWLACALWKHAGILADGVELNREAAVKGRKRLKRYGAPGRVISGNLLDAPAKVGRRYDAISLFEVLEHVPDVDQVLDAMESMLAPGGRIYLSTPNGAFDQGNSPYPWHKVEPKGHLRAIPAGDLIETLSARGKITGFGIEGGRVLFASYEPAERKGKVIFYAGPGWEPWSPRSVNDGGLGGSETALVHLAIRFAQAGWETKVYAGAEPGLYGGSLWRPHTAFDIGEECDLLIVSRLAHVFDRKPGAKRSVLWCHDHSYPGVMNEARAANIDALVVLSEWERERFERLHPETRGKLVVIRNGIAYKALGEPKFADAGRPFSERKPRCVYASSADRGLDVLLDLWPRIRAQVPDAELHVFYGWVTFDAIARVNPALLAMKAELLAKAREAGGEEGGVFMRGRLGQMELAQEMQQARVLTYPTAFLETSCIVAMEAQAAGLPMVTSDLGALHETVGEHGYLIPWFAAEDEPDNQSPAYQDVFVEETVKLLTDEAHWTHAHQHALAGADGIEWDDRLPEWEALAEAPAKARRAA